MDKTLEVKLIDIEREITTQPATFKTKTSNPTKNIPTESRIKECLYHKKYGKCKYEGKYKYLFCSIL